MTVKIILRIASVLLFIFMSGHTIGYLRWRKNPDPKGQDVIKAMNEYQFEFRGSMQTYSGHMEGYGLGYCFVLFSFASLLWIISGKAEANPEYSKLVLYPVLFFAATNIYVAYRFFFIGPALFSTLVTGLVGYAIWKLGRV